MLETYKAKLHGDKIEWETDAPKTLRKDKSVEVFITILEEDSESKELRPYGLGKGDFVVPNDFDVPLPEEILASFER
jgi:hypothetical protein